LFETLGTCFGDTSRVMFCASKNKAGCTPQESTLGSRGPGSSGRSPAHLSLSSRLRANDHHCPQCPRHCRRGEEHAHPPAMDPAEEETELFAPPDDRRRGGDSRPVAVLRWGGPGEPGSRPEDRGRDG